MLGGITLSTQILKANFVQLGKELEESSRMSGAGFWRTYFRIVFPLMAQTMVLVGVIKFMFAAQHNSAIILLATSETRTLSLLALDQVAAGYREVASITIIHGATHLGLAVSPGRSDSRSAFGRSDTNIIGLAKMENGSLPEPVEGIELKSAISSAFL